MKTFIYAMLCFPSVQLKAQKEVDELVDCEQRLPQLEDRGSLPYLEATLKEVLRWFPATPLGLHHCARESDLYDGYYIPAGTTVISNIWAMTRDEQVYKNPEVFDPERFLPQGPHTDAEADPRCIAFGFGRRICERLYLNLMSLCLPPEGPGQHLAEDSIWLQMALILATMTIQRAVDEDGNLDQLKTHPDDLDVTSGIVRCIKTIVDRST